MHEEPKPQESRRTLRLLAGAALSVLVTGTVVYHLLEGWSWVDSFYFSTVCVTTVGFGDLTPSSDAAKLFTVAYIFAGISIVGKALDVRMKHHGVAARRARRRAGTIDDGTKDDAGG